MNTKAKTKAKTKATYKIDYNIKVNCLLYYTKQMNALYTVEDKGTYKDIKFTEEGQTQIRDLFEKKQDQHYSAGKLLEELFPEMKEWDANVRKNATYQIQVVLERDYTGG